MNHKSQQSGQTMIETILYISVLIILGGVVAKLAGNMFTRYNTGRASAQIDEIRKIIINYTAVDETYENFTQDDMDRKKAFPSDLQSSYHALGGKYEVGPVADSSGYIEGENRYLFYIKFYDIKENACKEIIADGQFYINSNLDTMIVTKTSNSDYTSAWYYEHSYYDIDSISPDGDYEIQTSTASTLETLETIRPSMSQIIDACGDINDITWIFS